MAFRNAAAASASLPALAAASPWSKRAFAAGVPLLSRAASVVDGQKHPAASMTANTAIRA